MCGDGERARIDAVIDPVWYNNLMMSSLSKPNVAISLTLFSLAISGLLLWYGGELPKSSFPAVNLTAEQRSLLAMVTYLNAKGEKWSIPQGEYAFTVSSNPKFYPRFLSGDIDPLDVQVGDTQRMKIVVVDVAQPKRVWAEIEHDAGKDTVQLTLTGTKALAREELERRPYLVDESGELILNDALGLSVKSIVEKLVNRAEAAGEQEYTYEGSWVVHDTHTKTYRTTFNAESMAGKYDNFVMAWSDPVCTFDSNGFLSAAGCALSGTMVEGFDGNTNISGATVILSGSAVFAFSPGTTITIGTGRFGTEANLIQGGATIRKAQLYFSDADGDGYTANIEKNITGGIVARNVQGGQLNPTIDCYDLNANAKPGQTAYFSANRGDGSFDYNCDNTASMNPTQNEGAVCTGGSLETDGSQYTDYFGGCTNPVQVFYCAAGNPKACGQNFNPAIHLWDNNPNCGPKAYLLQWRPDVSTPTLCR